MPDKAVKITIRNGKLKRTFTLTAPSAPTEYIAVFSTSGGKLRQVFP